MARVREGAVLLGVRISIEMNTKLAQLAEESFNSRSGIARHALEIGLRQLLANREQ